MLFKKEPEISMTVKKPTPEEVEALKKVQEAHERALEAETKEHEATAIMYKAITCGFTIVAVSITAIAGGYIWSLFSDKRK